MNTVAETRRHQMLELRTQLDQMAGQFAAVLPERVRPERFLRVVLTAIQNSPDLLECERRSLFNACTRCATDGLQPDGREAALVVYKSKDRGKIAGYIPMIHGLRLKARQSGEISTWEAQVVHENDEFDYELGDAPFIRHKPKLGDRGAIIAAYSIAVLRDGSKSREVMSIDEIHKIRQRSRAERGPWETDFSEMCRKTVAKRHAKVLPTSNELETVFRRDEENESDDGAEPERLPPRPSFNAALERLAGPEILDDPIDADPDPAHQPHQTANET